MKKPRNDSVNPPPSSPGVRLNRYLAQAGVSSRRGADALIAAGRVTVNGAVVSDLGRSVQPGTDAVAVDDRPITPPAGNTVTVLLHKPRGVMCTAKDPEGRETVFDLLSPTLPRLFAVGRLDFQSEGALLLTNDGELAARLMHPRHHVPKIYAIKLQGELTRTDLESLESGIYLDGAKTLPLAISRERSASRGPNTWYEVVLAEGRNRQIRRMMEALGHRVMRLRRIAIGPVVLGDLPIGAWRYVEGTELEALRLEAGLAVHAPNFSRHASGHASTRAHRKLHPR